VQDTGLAVQMRVHLREDPEDGVPRHWAHRERRAAPLSRRGAAAGWEVPSVYPGDGGAPRAEARVRGGDARHRDRATLR
jgi:hypothetical protein